jgi:hypothetical protein|tara:strand:- start:833 stop:1072 length:240 start_codon:yes stop_codon:yes gene_type:complete
MEYTDLKFLIELKDTMEREIMTLTNILESKNLDFENLKNVIYKKCDHEWANDFIDHSCKLTGNHASTRVSYCKKCCSSN